MRVRQLCNLLALLLLTGLAWAEQGPPRPEDFAWGMDLQIQQSKALYRFPLPRVVYEGVTRADLGDLAVFNAQGHLVPHDLVRPSAHEQAPVEQRQVSLFPLYGRQDANLQTLSIQLTRPLAQGQLKLHARGTYRNQQEVLRGHILTLREAEEKLSVATLWLQWQPQATGVVQRLRVEQSNDLTRWRLVQGRAVIADLRHNGERLRKDSIKLGGVSGRYLRITPLGKEPAVLFSQARIELNPTAQARQTQQMWLQSVTAGEQVGEYLFELPPALPVTRINVIPGESNSFVRARLYSKSHPGEKWIQRASGLIYNLMADGAVVQQTALVIGAANARYWRLSVDMSGGGFGATPPQISVSWLSHDLLFSARGQEPFILAYGSARIEPVADSGHLLRLGSEQTGGLVGDQIQLGQPYVLAGRGVLLASYEVAWKQWLLWAVLILASLLLVGMAWSTFRQMAR